MVFASGGSTAGVMTGGMITGGIGVGGAGSVFLQEKRITAKINKDDFSMMVFMFCILIDVRFYSLRLNGEEFDQFIYPRLRRGGEFFEQQATFSDSEEGKE